MSRATGYLGIVGVWLALLALPAFCSGDDCAQGPAGTLVHTSAFAHGYLHGYEAGFHTGDMDFHIAQARDPREMRELERLAGYQPSFGSRTSFNAGFRRGLFAGYQDGVSGRDFRAFQWLSASITEDASRPADFDQGFQEGYKAGENSGAGDLDHDRDFDPGAGVCPARTDPNGRLPASSQAYCAGYLSAYRVGYTDGFLYASPGNGGAVLAAR